MSGLHCLVAGAALLASAIPSATAWGQTPDRLETGGLGASWGEPAAPVQVVEFTDPSCPYCARFHEETRDSLFSDFVKTGQARWTTLPYVSGQYPNSSLAASALVCASRTGDDGFEALIRGLYASRDAWVGASGQAARAHILARARETGLPGGELARCLEAPSTGQAVEEIRRMALENGVRGTPTYFVDGFPLMGALPYPFVKRVFDQRLDPGGG